MALPGDSTIEYQGGSMNAGSTLALVLLSLVSFPASAGFTQVPEPGVLELLAIGAVAGVAIAIRKRRK
jgi:hypothetical protein